MLITKIADKLYPSADETAENIRSYLVPSYFTIFLTRGILAFLDAVMYSIHHLSVNSYSVDTWGTCIIRTYLPALYLFIYSCSSPLYQVVWAFDRCHVTSHEHYRLFNGFTLYRHLYNFDHIGVWSLVQYIFPGRFFYIWRLCLEKYCVELKYLDTTFDKPFSGASVFWVVLAEASFYFHWPLNLYDNMWLCHLEIEPLRALSTFCEYFEYWDALEQASNFWDSLLMWLGHFFWFEP